MDSKPKKNQHYVPKFYLRNFAFRAERIYVYDRLEKKLFENSINNICQEKYLYETKWENASKKFGGFVELNKIENSFVNDEGEYDKTIKSILSKEQNDELSVFLQTNKETIAEFVVNIYLRNPFVLNSIVSSTNDEKLKEEKTLKAVFSLFDYWKLGSPESLIVHSIKKSTFDHSIENGPSSVLKQNIMDMKLILLRSKIVQFITSCHPIIIVAKDGIPPEADILDILLPISPNTALWFTDDPNNNNKDNCIMKVNYRDVKSINRIYLDYSIKQARFLLSKNRYILEEMIKEG